MTPTRIPDAPAGRRGGGSRVPGRREPGRPSGDQYAGSGSPGAQYSVSRAGRGPDRCELPRDRGGCGNCGIGTGGMAACRAAASCAGVVSG